MIDLPELLVRTAQRGVEVTIFTNAHPAVQLRLRWQQTVSNMDAQVRSRAAGYDLYVRDCDGDFSTWRVRRHGLLVAEGTENYGDLYHCDAACLAA